MSDSKLFILHHLPDNNDRPALERWFHDSHCPEVCAQAPSLTRYLLYRPVPPPPGAEGLGYINYRVHENWVRSPDERRGLNGLLSFSPQPGYMDVAVVNVPGEPTDDFHGAELRYGDGSILRWVTLFRYPDGVPVDEAEDWYRNVHVPETCRQTGLRRFFSHRAIEGAAIPHSTKQRPVTEKPSPLFMKKWHRLSELWYENDAGWIESNVTNPPAYTQPPWATRDEYPFLVPGDEFLSTFLLERPDADLLRDGPRRYF
jgi:hypothetical protein